MATPSTRPRTLLSAGDVVSAELTPPHHYDITELSATAEVVASYGSIFRIVQAVNLRQLLV